MGSRSCSCLLTSAVGLVACNGGDDGLKLRGLVRSGSTGLAGYDVALYASFVDRADGWQLLGTSVTDGNGAFQLFYSLPPERSVLIVLASAGRSRSRARSATASTRPRRSSSTSAPPSRPATRSRSS